MRGTPYYYMGDELGMSNIKFDNIDDYKDIMTINWYQLTKAEGGDLDKFMESHKLCARDNARTPVQWDDSENAGFTTGTPWIKVNPNYVDVNAAAQENDPDSELNYFRKLNQVRKDNLTLIYGAYTLLLAEHTEIYAYTRTLDDDVILVLLNYSEKTVTVIDYSPWLWQPLLQLVIQPGRLDRALQALPRHGRRRRVRSRRGRRDVGC